MKSRASALPVFCRRVGQTPNPKPFQTSPAVSERRDSERSGGAVESCQKIINRREHNTHTHPRRTARQHSEAGRRGMCNKATTKALNKPPGSRIKPHPAKNPHSPEKPHPHVRTNQNRKQTPKRQKPPPNKTPSCATPKQTPETPRKPNPETPGNHTIIYLQKHPGNPLLPLTPTILLAEKERTKQPDYPCLRFRLKSRSLPHK